MVSLQAASTSRVRPTAVFRQLFGEVFWLLFGDGSRDIADLNLGAIVEVEVEVYSPRRGQGFWSHARRRIFRLVRVQQEK